MHYFSERVLFCHIRILTYFHVKYNYLYCIMQITLLIRCSYRPNGFKATYASIPAGINVICSYDDDRALAYIPEHLQKIRVYKSSLPFFYDNYCNDLKALVPINHYFAFLDEGDTIIPNSLSLLTKELKNSNGVICQFKRGDKLKPSAQLIKERRILRGKVGMPCLFLHSKFASLVDLDGSVGAADYHWIKAVSRHINLKYVAIPVVSAEIRHQGSLEG